MSIVGRTLNRKHEVEYLLKALGNWFDSPHNKNSVWDEISRGHHEKLELLRSLKQTHTDDYECLRARQRKEFQLEYPVFTATLDYGATGEGRLLLFIARRAHSKGDFLAYLCGEISGYYAQGVTMYEGLPPDTDYPYRQLVSNGVKQFLKHEIGASGNRWLSGHVDVVLQQYVNYS